MLSQISDARLIHCLAPDGFTNARCTEPPTSQNDSARNVPAELVSLTAISPLDGRYGRQTAELRDIFSEFAFMRERLRVESLAVRLATRSARISRIT